MNMPNCTAVTEHAVSSPCESIRSWFARTTPTFLVLAILGAVAFAGHHTGWKVPKFSDMIGGSAEGKDDWCEEHSVPESICVECDESLMPRIKSTWCRKHGVHNCPFERPDIVQTKSTPVVSQEDLARADRALAMKERKANGQKCKIHHRRIQFANADVMDKMGIDIRPVSTGPIVETVSASGELAFEQPLVAPVSAPVAGRLWHVTEKGAQGSHVRRGDVLALVDAAEVGKAKGELLQAFAQAELRKRTVDMLKPLVPIGAASQSQLHEAELGFREARIRLMVAERSLANMGLPIRVDELKASSTEDLSNRLVLFGLPENITCNVRGRDLGSFVHEAEAKLKGVSMPSPRYHMEFGGQYEHLISARNRLLIVIPGAIVLICGLLYLKELAMRHILAAFGLVAVVAAHASDHDGAAFHPPDTVKWEAGPASLPKGVMIAVLEGNPTKEGPFVFRLKAPNGYRIPLHTHPKAERVTVVSGTFNIFMPEDGKTVVMPAGTYGNWPAGMKHEVWTKGETVLQFHGVGPWTIRYVNPKDDPRKR